MSQDKAPHEKLHPNIGSAAAKDWARRPFPGSLPHPAEVIPVVIRRPVLEAIRKHGLSRTDVEVCGVLVGNGYQDDRGPFVYVEAMVEGAPANGQAAQVTFTADTWAYMQGVLDRDYPDKRIIGWYHTHPGFGIFLSPMDLFIHQNFFSAPEQVALVFDPISGKDGVFVWHNGKAVESPVWVEEDIPQRQMSAVTNSTSDQGMSVEATKQDLTEKVRHLERRQRWLSIAVLLAFVTALLWPLGVRSLLDDQSGTPQGEHPGDDILDDAVLDKFFDPIGDYEVDREDPAKRPKHKELRDPLNDERQPDASDNDVISDTPTRNHDDESHDSWDGESIPAPSGQQTDPPDLVPESNNGTQVQPGQSSPPDSEPENNTANGTDPDRTDGNLDPIHQNLNKSPMGTDDNNTDPASTGQDDGNNPSPGNVDAESIEKS